MQRVMLTVCVVAMLVVGAQASAARYAAPCSAAAGTDGRVYVGEAAAKAIVVLDAAGGKIVDRFRAGGEPNGLCLSHNGKTLVAAVGGAQGKVVLFDAASGRSIGSVAVGHTPMAPVVSPDDTVLYVCNRFDNTVSVIDLKTKKEIVRIPTPREPVAAALTPDGARLFIASLLSTDSSDGAYTAAHVYMIDTAAKKVVNELASPNGVTGIRGLCVSPDGKFVYAVHVLAHYQLPTTQLERGWMNANAMTVIDAAEPATVATVLLDDVELGAANPWAVSCTADGKYLCVTHAGSQDLSVIDRAALHARLDAVKQGKKVTEVSSSLADVSSDLSFLAGIRRRINLAGNGPRALALLGDTAYVPEYFTDSVSIVNLAPGVPTPVRPLPLVKKVVCPPERKGEQFFNDASLCFQKWQSCASCHPDSRVDGVNWDLLNDGIGNPKNSKSMLLSHVTPPVMSLGVRDNAEKAVRAGIRFIQFAVRPDEDAVAIDTYLKSMKPVPSPLLKKGKLSPQAREGEALFTSAGCMQCHMPPLYTDLKTYDVDSGTGMDKGKPFDTPTLIEVWRTAPYLHDGSAATMMDVLKTHNKGDKHGVTSNLSDEQLQALAAFVMSL